MDSTTATQPTAEEIALQGRIKALQAVAEMLHDDLSAYADKQPVDAGNAAALKVAIETHVVATGEFCDSALALVPPTGRFGRG